MWSPVHGTESNVRYRAQACAQLRQPTAKARVETGAPTSSVAIREAAVTDRPEFEVALIRDHLEKLRSSTAFSRSSRLFAFLFYVVEETLAGRGQTLKELVVGDALYSGFVSYDPRIVSTVRVEARRLRRRLADYYDREGRTDPVRIDLPTGSYRPVFATGVSGPMPDWRRKAEAQCLGADLAIMPFRALSTDAGDDSFADGLTDELIFALQHRSQLKLSPRLMVFQYKNRAYSLSEAAESLGVGAVLHGTFRSAGARARVTVELSNPQGFVTWSVQVDEATAEPILLQEKLAGAIVARMPEWIVGSPFMRSIWHLSPRACASTNTDRSTPAA